MKRSKVLPMKYPFVAYHSDSANSLSVLSYYNETYPWLMNCFIQIAHPLGEGMDFTDFYYRDCPFLEYHNLDRIFINRKWNSFSDFIIDALENDFYCMTEVKTSEIRAYKEDAARVHDAFVYGYEEEKKLFYFAGFLGDRKYEFGECTYEEMNNAQEYVLQTGGRNWEKDSEFIHLFRYQYDDRFTFDIQRVRCSIEDYLNGELTSNWHTKWKLWRPDFPMNRNCRFGIQCYDYITDGLCDIELTGKPPYHFKKGPYLFWKHKFIMNKRAEFMYERGFLRSDNLMEQIKEIEKKAQIAQNLTTRSYILENYRKLNCLIEKYEEIKESEDEWMHKVIEQMPLI